MSRVTWFLLAAVPLALMQSPHAAPRRGPHGGEVKRAVGAIADQSLELVIVSDSEKREIHIYGVDANNRPVNLSSSGYGGLVYRLGAVELPLDLHKVNEDGHISNASERVEHYRAIGKFPDDPKIELEVTIAFPGKQGTGKATFRPFRK